MDNFVNDSTKTAQDIDVPRLYGNPFVPSAAEKIAVIFSYPLAYLYTYILIPPVNRDNWYPVTAAFIILFCALSEIFYHRRKATAESYAWLGCIAVILVSMLAGLNRVWGDSLAVFFIHGYAVYWILNRSGRLIEGRSGPFTPVDMMNGFIVFPFKNFFLRIKVLLSALKSRERKNGEKTSRAGTVAAIAGGLILLYIAGALLAAADDTFDRLVGDILRLLDIDFLKTFIPRFLLSLPVGAYLYGLVIGTNREDVHELEERGGITLNRLETLKKVPAKAWMVILGGFSLLYLLFFVIQGSYLFGAFTRTLPEGFTVAQYARQGFFELCQIMGINFLLFWLVMKSSNIDIRSNRFAMIMCSVLLAESLLFSVTAFSKLMLYISCFGFTPRRLQSTWLICVLFAGTALALYSLWTRKRTFRIWIYISGISLALMHLY